MKTLLKLVSAVLFSAVTLALAGCGEKGPKINLDEQVSALSGDADAKIIALGEIATLGEGAASAVDRILPLLKDPDPVVRRTAAFALGAIGPAAKAAVPELKTMMQTGDRDQLTAVVNALRAIEPAAAGGVQVENVSN
ncbi:MAG TPA: HEAT repeat domain-containing protein [Verrucomicrobiota bacterium]|nr:HEAT repeat domain-containing protein [Verrucomicrobiota bacterium]